MVKITEELVRKKSEHNECLISTLEELSLHQEDIDRIEHLHGWCRDLKILLLQSNLISKIENLHKLKKLEYLNLAVNNIERVENLEQLESLNKLDLTLNFIGELTSIESLRDNYNLRILILTGNPCCEYPNYREFVIGTLPQLESLDCEDIKTTQKLEAKQQLKRYRDVIVQHQVRYAMKRDEQKLRVAQQREALAAQMAEIEDEDLRIKTFWDSKSEHCPETRYDIAKYHKMGRDRANANNEAEPHKKTPRLFAPTGRPYSLNQAKLPFHLQDEADQYHLELDVYKHLDTSQIKVDVETNYVRVTVKKKVFQLAFAEEVKIAEATVRRSQITGKLSITMPKLHFNQLLCVRTKQDASKKDQKITTKAGDLQDTVDIHNICATPADVPDLI